MDTSSLIQSLKKDLAIELPAKISFEKLKEQLSAELNHLIETDFHKLISLLYRVDISEPKLKNLLKENPGKDAGKIIAELIIERQLQKIKSRQQLSRRDKNIDENEKW
ncbi:MAG TPA: hypothetical protein VET23_13610 [Chitinophagaceae bacterium]|nr:hypothetical protein [Chitinophagaceae bacterium]